MALYKEIGVYDYNPVHALWYVLVDQLGLPESWVDPDSFLSAAQTVHSENRGVGIRLSEHADALSYIKNILEHIEAVLYYDVDGTLHLKLIREDYTISNLLEVDDSVLVAEPAIERGSFLETYSEIKVQYNKRIVDILPWVYHPGLIPAPTFTVNGDSGSTTLTTEGIVLYSASSPSFWKDGSYILEKLNEEGELIEQPFPVRMVITFPSVAGIITYTKECTNTTLEMTSAGMCSTNGQVTRTVTGDRDYIPPYMGIEPEWIFGLADLDQFGNWELGIDQAYAQMQVQFDGVWMSGDKATVDIGITGELLEYGYIIAIYGHYISDGGGR